MDRNGNGVLEPAEIPEDRRRMFGYLAERFGFQPDQPIPLSRIRESMANRERGDSESGGADKKSAEPLVPAFGEEIELARVPEFGERVENGLTGSPTRGSSSARSPSRSDDRSDRVRRFAEAMLRRYDRNRNGVLERDEWAGMRSAEAADRNHDGRVTVDELTERLADYSRRRSGESDRERDGSDGSETPDSNDRRSYRLLTAIERLPEGLPDWFVQRDGNADGQVAMAEFTSFWTESEANRFARYDHNGDGMITPRECLDGETEMDVVAAPGDSVGLVGSPVPQASGSSESSGGEGESKAWWE